MYLIKYCSESFLYFIHLPQTSEFKLESIQKISNDYIIIISDTIIYNQVIKDVRIYDGMIL